MSVPQVGMATGFSSIIDFRLKRSWLAALGFYVTYVIAGVFMGVILVIVISAVILPSQVSTYSQGFNFGIYAGRLLSMIYAGSILALVMQKRNAWRNMVYLACLAGSVVLAYFIGALGGLLPTAILLALKGPEPGKSAI